MLKKFKLFKKKIKDLRKHKKNRKISIDFKKKLYFIDKVIENNKVLNFLHSGHMGDLIYALPVIKKLSENHTCNLFIGINKIFTNEKYKNHTSAGVLINDRIFNYALPLIGKQKYLNKVQKYIDQKIDINLDLFRDMPGKPSNSSKWYFHITGVHADLHKPFLDTQEHDKIKNKIVISRSLRNKNSFIDYSFLNDFCDQLIFIGLKDEYLDLKKVIPELKHYDPLDFFEMSQIIKSSKFFLGNQSSPFAIAEGLKVPRLLENTYDVHDVEPTGGNCYDFFYQTHFEKFFYKLLNR
ncbi:hypothetical protein N9Y77_05090 [Candidatus Pelagibacter bacterium]|jgi:hypothetical protein|nr:hypothetical protein [Candidatus Pelagibacter bacterium]